MPDALHLGSGADGEVCLPLDAATRRMAILAMSGAGKSNASVVMAEGMYDAGIPWVAIDPKGDWYGVRSAGTGDTPGLPIPIFGGRHGDLPLEPHAGKMIAELIVEQRLTCVLDVSDFDTRQQMWGFLADLGETLLRRNSHPLHLFLEEADEYIPQTAREGGNQVRCLGVWQRVVKRGRTPAGLGSTQITQRSASLNNDTLYMAEALFALRNVGPGDLKAIKGWVEHSGSSAEILQSLPTLGDGEAWLSSPAWLRRTERFQFKRRRTFDSGATPVFLEAGRAPATLADVDLDQLRERMADTVARIEADDPAKLRVEIVRLAAQLRVAKEEAPADSKAVNALQAQVQELRVKNIRLAGEVQEARTSTERIAAALGREREAIDAAIAARRPIHEIMLNPIPPKEASDATTRTSGLRRDERDHQADPRPGGDREEAAARGAGTLDRPDDAGYRRAGDGLGQVPTLAQPRGMGEGTRRAQGARGVGPDLRQRGADRPRVPGRDTNDMTDDEVEQLIERILDRRGMVLRVEVPAAEVIRHDYQRKAVERVLAKVDEVLPEQREVVRFMLGQETSLAPGRIAAGLGLNNIQVGNLLKALTDRGVVARGGASGGGTAYRPRIREWITAELAPHGPTDAEVDEVYQAVLGRIAVA